MIKNSWLDKAPVKWQKAYEEADDTVTRLAIFMAVNADNTTDEAFDEIMGTSAEALDEQAYDDAMDEVLGV